MRILRYNQPGFAEALARALAASSLFDQTIEERVRGVIAAVQERGDDALLEFTERFDSVKLVVAQLAVTEPTPAVDAELRKAVATAQVNVAAFAKRALPKDWQMRNAQGGRVGEKFDPLQRVGVYIPGGTAPLVSTAIMTVAIAKVAGCREIVACTPPNEDAKNLINLSLLYALRKAGATEIYRVGGAQAIAAMALGTQTIRRVQKIFGPGNAYVTTAKRLLFGHVGVDLLAGPSEILVIADDSADARFIAADMLAQAEHGSGHERVWLVTTSEKILEATQREIQRQQRALSRGGFIGRALDASGACVLVKDMKQAVDVANRFAPEHCEVMTKNAARLVCAIKTAGAIFVGPWTPTVVGDYLAGPSHELPTGGTGAMFAGLTVDQFQRRASVVEFSQSALRKSMRALETIGAVERLDAHVASARIRFDSRKKRS
jgi:histidinol dehydrogenase